MTDQNKQEPVKEQEEKSYMWFLVTGTVYYADANGVASYNTNAFFNKNADVPYMDMLDYTAMVSQLGLTACKEFNMTEEAFSGVYKRCVITNVFPFGIMTKTQFTSRIKQAKQAIDKQNK